MQTEARIPARRAAEAVVAPLTEVLLDTYALMLTTQVYHWNVEGPQFFALHAAFEAQYRELFEASDALAERIRALGAYAPSSAEVYVRRDSIRPEGSPLAAERMVSGLIAGHESLLGSLRGLLRTAAAAADDVTADLATGRLQKHEQTLWMLRSVAR